MFVLTLIVFSVSATTPDRGVPIVASRGGTHLSVSRGICKRSVVVIDRV